MADFLFCFVGRQNRLTYVFRLFVAAVSFAAILAASAALGDWPFKGIVLGVLAAGAVCLYMSAVTNRLQDFGMNAFVGLGFYYVLPVAIFMIGSSVAGEIYTGSTSLAINALTTMQMPDVTPMIVLSWITQIASIGLFLFGQLSLLLRRGDRGANDYGEAPTGWIGHTRPEGA